ncbi:MAG: hypothetical protein KC933_05840 [Myxococcales bacterium]|nr:hypothetical protein [Myxococcales bacterium]
MHVLRDGVTGQPILAKRWIEYPQDVYDWGYCPLPIDAQGVELPLIDLTCDPVDPTAAVEVDYFGRLSGGRTKERNQRMHFDEVIMGIKDAEQVRQDAAGRLRLGTGCFVNAAGNIRCASWRTIDSPMENLALYARLMRYGHIQTDPAEVDIWAEGDPAAGTVYHPALAPEDYEKFGGGVLHLLPGAADWLTRATTCFVGGAFQATCAAPKVLQNRDLIRASSFLGAAANKEGIITIDLVQYMNRILAITKDTPASLATLRTLPALIRDCGDDPDDPLPPDQCTIVPASADSRGQPTSGSWPMTGSATSGTAGVIRRWRSSSRWARERTSSRPRRSWAGSSSRTAQPRTRCWTSPASCCRRRTRSARTSSCTSTRCRPISAGASTRALSQPTGSKRAWKKRRSWGS